MRILAVFAALAAGLSILGSSAITKPGSSLQSPQLVQTQEAGDDWLALAQRGLAEKEYEASHNHVGLQAPNRAHNLRTYFDSSEIRVHTRTAEGDTELLSLSLSGIGRSDRMEPVEPGEVVSEGARVEIRRPGLVEWYANSPKGLEQGFTVSERLRGEGPLVLELAVEGARALRRGTDVVFQAQTGRRLEYGKLAAMDAEGRTLVARLEVPEALRLRLVVEDEGAAYPVMIDPLFTAAADAQLESNQMEAHLGLSVAGAGDVNGDGYDDVIVGAWHYDAGEMAEGAAFVFLGSASGLADGDPSTADAQLESNQIGAHLGSSVAGAGDVNGDGYGDVIVGANSYDPSKGGAAFVFLGSASGIADGDPSTADTRLESNQMIAEMGQSVAGAGDVNGDGYDDVIVGAFNYDAGEWNEGAAFVFLGSASGIADGNPSTADAQLESDQMSASLGHSVAGAGDVNGDGYADVIVGASSYGAGESNEGAAFVFLGSASGIADGNPSTADAQLESDQIGAHLGQSVAGAGDVNGDGYDDVIVGAGFYNAGETTEGAAFVFLGSASGIADGDPSTADTRLESNQVNAHLGVPVAGTGDVNGDGYDDVIVGAGSYDVGDRGAAFVFLGSASGIADGDPSTADAQLESDQIGAHLGSSVAGAGDLNGDGYDDVIVGAGGYDAGETDEGTAFVFLGSAFGIMDPACGDGIDNDGDGLIDFPSDPGCANALDQSENAPDLICDDGLDNDSDGLIDYPYDPGCSSPLDVTEEFDCGDGSLDPGEQCDDGNNDDGDGCSALCELENLPPVAQCQDVTVPTDPGVCFASASVDAGSFDPDGDPITLDQSPASPYDLGTTLVTLTVTDDSGASDSCSASVTVVDTTPPDLSLSVAPDTLWPPNHKLVEITVVATTSDWCDPAPNVELVSVTMDEGEGTLTYDPLYDQTLADGHTTDDIQVTDDGRVFLRAERSGTGDGRVYTLTYRATDASGNATTASAMVTVPHNQ